MLMFKDFFLEVFLFVIITLCPLHIATTSHNLLKSLSWFARHARSGVRTVHHGSRLMR
jgi:hypothetical protein